MRSRRSGVSRQPHWQLRGQGHSGVIAEGPRPGATADATVTTICRRDLAKMIDQWPHVMRLATSSRAQQFAFSIWARSADPRWRPTARQLRVMRTMLREVAAGECGAGTLLEE